jgi:hypothetical protein
MFRTLLQVTLLCALSLPALAEDDTLDAAVGGAIGGAVGAAIGNEVGGRDGAVLGGAIGGAAGVAIATESDGDDGRGPVIVTGGPADHRGLPPGLAKKGKVPPGHAW